MVPVYIPLLLPLTIIAIPAADLVLAIVRRTWNGQSPFAADRGHLHHRLLEVGHSHSRAVLIMYFWSALIAFGAVAYRCNSASMWIVLAWSALSAMGSSSCCCRASRRAPRAGPRLRPAALPAAGRRAGGDGAARPGRRCRRTTAGSGRGRVSGRQRGDRVEPPFAASGPTA